MTSEDTTPPAQRLDALVQEYMTSVGFRTAILRHIGKAVLDLRRLYEWDGKPDLNGKSQAYRREYERILDRHITGEEKKSLAAQIRYYVNTAKDATLQGEERELFLKSNLKENARDNARDSRTAQAAVTTLTRAASSGAPLAKDSLRLLRYSERLLRMTKVPQNGDVSEARELLEEIQRRSSELARQLVEMEQHRG